MHGMVSNLLDMARLGRPVKPRRWQSSGRSRAPCSYRAMPSPGVASDRPAADLPLIEFDAVLIERVFCNLLENAAKYSPPDTSIIVTGSLPMATRTSASPTRRGFPEQAPRGPSRLFVRGDSDPACPAQDWPAICRAQLSGHTAGPSAPKIARPRCAVTLRCRSARRRRSTWNSNRPSRRRDERSCARRSRCRGRKADPARASTLKPMGRARGGDRPQRTRRRRYAGRCRRWTSASRHRWRRLHQEFSRLVDGADPRAFGARPRRQVSALDAGADDYLAKPFGVAGFRLA